MIVMCIIPILKLNYPYTVAHLGYMLSRILKINKLRESKLVTAPSQMYRAFIVDIIFNLLTNLIVLKRLSCKNSHFGFIINIQPIN